ncbi:MAG: biopolymer transporter ExbD [Candidatus Dadabacteria bacterium]|nr:MAG: biopolymer transporter ExbD [Candidatus Dadabacteria bacterium]
MSFGMTALIDMAFLLITFFIMSLRLGQEGEQLVELPRADQAVAERDARVELLVVNVTANGGYLVAGSQRSLSEIQRLLDARVSPGKRFELIVRGDRRAPFTSVRKILRLAAERGVRSVSLAALQLPEEEP